MEKRFNPELKRNVAESIPCIHMNSMSLADRALKTMVKYLRDAQSRGITTIEQVLNDIEKED